jgi:hypothetical protein
MTVENSAQPSAAEQLSTTPSITNKQPSGEPASKTTPPRYHLVNNTEGYIEMNKLIRSEDDVLVGINREDLSGWPHKRVQNHIHNQFNDRNKSTIHLTFMDALRANDLHLQFMTNSDSNKHKRTAEEDS